MRNLTGNLGLLLRKAILCVLLVLGLSAKLNAQFVTIPDTNLVNYLLLRGYGACMSGNSIDSTCTKVLNTLYLTFDTKNIHDLTGLIAFTNLQTLVCNDNHMYTLPKLPNSLTSFNSLRDGLSTITQLPPNLYNFSCRYNNLSNITYFPDSVRSIYCDNNHLSSLPSLPTTLWRLVCTDNYLRSLPTLSFGLENLDCSNNYQLTSLPTLPATLKNLDCYRCAISNIPNFPASIKNVSCALNQLQSLPAIPSNAHVVTFSCSSNQITSLQLSDTVEHLFCNGNKITQISPMATYMLDMNCDGNLLTSFPFLPSSLTSLSCNYNLLTTFPALPTSLITLGCQDNVINSFPPLPTKLVTLYCAFNQFSSLPSLPKSLKNLTCDNTLLTQLPELPDTMNTLSCMNNPNLTCLPQLKVISNLNFSSTGVSCLPNYGKVTASTPALSTVPLCDFFNVNGCSVFWNISGKSYFDVNSNCTFNNTDVQQSNNHILLYHDSILEQQAFTGGEGYYSFKVDTIGRYSTKIDTSDIPFTVLCPSLLGYSDSIASSTSLFYSRDFSLKCKTGFDLAAWSIYSQGFRPGHNQLVRINAGDYSNLFGAHCASGIGGEVRIMINGPTTFTSAASGSLVPVVNMDTLIYQVADFGTINSSEAFNFFLNVDTMANSGDQVCVTVNVSLILGDNNISNNILSNCFTVQNSFDPNIKSVFPKNIVDANGDHWLNYTIQFQNTGTTTAEHIYVIDTLDTKLDLSTFQLLAYSHQPYVQILNGGIVKFNFANIYLPDSTTNEELSHGYVQYKIKVKDTLTPGTIIQNTAFIYFDFNIPVATNTVSNTYLNCLANSTAFNIEICKPNFYEFNGSNLFQSGIYLKHFTTLGGCDSVLQLNLNVISYEYNESQTICHGQIFILGTDTLRNTGIYNRTYSGAYGCDSVVHFHLTVTPSIVNHISTTICKGQTIQFGQSQLNQSGIYYDSLVTNGGCDSIVEFQLTVSPPLINYVNSTICTGQSFPLGSLNLVNSGLYIDTLFTNSGCDSIVRLQLMVTPPIISNVYDSICYGHFYQLGTKHLFTSGWYIDTLSTINGCDSIVNLHLFVKPFPVNLSVTISNGNLISLATSSTYQWYNCNSSSIISSAISQVYHPNHSGDYAVIVTNGPCSDTSLCYNIAFTGLNENNFSDIQVLPNPSHEIFNVKFPEYLNGKEFNLEVTDMLGKEIEKIKVLNGETILNAQKWETGIYLLKISSNDGSTTIRKLIKN